MLKQNKLFRGVILLLLLLLSGCSQNDGYATSEVATNVEPVVINGHTLPSKPDPKINNSTLLGIDSNNNGVRDDVEIWIYQTYKDKHPIYIDIAMQAGRAWQKVLEDPTKAKEIHIAVSAPMYCEGYYKSYANKYGDALLVKQEITSKFFRREVVFNTKDRLKAYWQYDTLLSGDTYTIPWSNELKAYCDFNTSKYE